MPTIKEIKKQAQIEMRARKDLEFKKFLVKQFGRELVVGDILQLPSSAIINGAFSKESHSNMVVYQIGPSRDTHLLSIGLIKQDTNRSDWTDKHNNYCLAYGKTRLKRAKLVGTEEIRITPEGVGFSDIY